MYHIIKQTELEDICKPLRHILLVVPGIFVFTKSLRFIPQFFIIIMVLLGSPNELMLQFKYLCDYYTECGHMSDWIMNFNFLQLLVII